jgi:apolipoprotein D and lipocalin family protein
MGAFTVACTKTRTARLGLPPLASVNDLDLNRYAGTWYEIASYPQRFQEGCTGTTATYTLNKDGTIGVLNRCRKDGLDGPEVKAEGRARMTDPSDPAKLEVSFFGPFWGDYWVIDLDEDYRFAVIGQPSRDYLWILSRTPTMPAPMYQGILERLTAQHYPLEPLNRTVHAEAATPRGASD